MVRARGRLHARSSRASGRWSRRCCDSATGLTLPVPPHRKLGLRKVCWPRSQREAAQHRKAPHGKEPMSQYRVEPGKRVQLAKRDLSDAAPFPDRKLPRRRARRTPRRSTPGRTSCSPKASGRCWSCCRASTRRARTAPSGTCSTRPARWACTCHALRQAERGGAGARLSVARASRRARAAASSACSTARTTRTCWWCGCASWRRRGDRAALRADQRVREDAGRERHDDAQVHAAHLEGGAGASGCRSAWTSRTSAGSSTRATWRNASCGTSTRRAYEMMLNKMLDGVGAVACDPGRSQVGPQRRHRRDRARDAGDDGSANIQSPTGTQRTSRSIEGTACPSTSPPSAPASRAPPTSWWRRSIRRRGSARDVSPCWLPR